MSDYNYDQFSAGAYNLDDSIGPQIGEAAPNFTVTRRDGSKTQLLEFTGDFLVLELGSITCPLFQGRRHGMQPLVEKFPDVSFVVLYVREAHPGQAITQHDGITDKLACATLLAEGDHEIRDIVVDDLAGTAHRAYGEYPNSVFIINRQRTVVFQSDWNNPAATRRALQDLTAGHPANRRSFFTPTFPHILAHTFRQAGPGSAGDFMRSLPQLIWKNVIKRNLRTLFTRQRIVAPDQSPS